MTDTAAVRAADKPETVRVWDVFQRVFHWSVVAGCCANLFILEPGSVPHQAVGFTVLGLMAARIVWGFIGTTYARFSNFVPGPTTLLRYLKALAKGREPRMLGHNPAASVMIVALIVVVSSIAITGWMSTLDAFWGIEWVSEAHETLADLLMVMVALHASAAIIESVRHRENLILSMITGRKRA
jgi:cytochrome b